MSLNLSFVSPVVEVADCACLMSLDKADAVPVDTHIWQIAKRDYKCAAGSTQKTLTDKVNRDIGQHEFSFFNSFKKFPVSKQML